MGSSSSPVYNPGALGLYNQQLGLMTQNYQNILGGYATAQGNVSNSLQGIYSGYDSARDSVLNTLGVGNGGWGVAAPAAEQIQKQFTNAQGSNQQALISAGLGNSSLLAQSNNQAAGWAAQAYGSLGSQLASTAAGYQAQFDLARQAAQMQGLGMQTNLAQNYMSNLAGYHFSPNVPLYGQQNSSWADYGGGGGGGGGGRGGSGGGSSSGGGMFSDWLMNSGVPMYNGSGGIGGMGYSGGWYDRRDNYGYGGGPSFGDYYSGDIGFGKGDGGYSGDLGEGRGGDYPE